MKIKKETGNDSFKKLINDGPIVIEDSECCNVEQNPQPSTFMAIELTTVQPLFSLLGKYPRLN